MSPLTNHFARGKKNLGYNLKMFCIVFILFLSILNLQSCKVDDIEISEQNLLTWNIPQHPFLSSSGNSNVHNDGYMTDAYPLTGIDGNGVKMKWYSAPKIFITLAFSCQGKLITLGTSTKGDRAMYLIDPLEMSLIDSFALPSSSELTASGTGYFYLDNNDQVVVPTVNKHIFRIGIREDSLKFIFKKDYDLSSIPDPCHIVSALPDWNGNIWFVTEEGLVGIVQEDGSFNYIQLKHSDENGEVFEKIDNSFASDEKGGIYVVSDYALYGLWVDKDNKPQIEWREEYDRGSQKKPGQFLQGSGTTPTLIGNDYVTITDNADPRMNVLVYKRKKNFSDDRLLCKVPVFKDNASATENSLIVYHNSIFVENNYGYTRAVDFIGKYSEPGFSRIDFHSDGRCETVWESNIIIPSLVSKLAIGNETLYTYTKETDGWYLTGVDANSGTTIFQVKAGDDKLGLNNHYSGLAIGPDGSIFVGVLGGIIHFYKE